MSPSACKKKKTEVISVVCSLSLKQLPQDVKALEEKIVEVVNQSGRNFYGTVFAAYQQQWLDQRREEYRAERWREINQVTPFGLVRLPVRVVRHRRDGHYVTLSRLLRPKATRLLSPWVEKRALEAATSNNYRPAAAELWRWMRVRVSAWLIWRCVQYHGAKLSEQLDRQWWPDRAMPKKASVVVSEMDSTYLKCQRRGRAANQPATHFPIHLGIHYSGRARRYQKRGSLSVCLQNKRWIMSTHPLSIFGRRFAWQRERHFAHGAPQVVLSDGDEGLKWIREREFAHSYWLLDRWHIAQKVRGFVGEDQAEYGRIMSAVWKADSEAVLETLRTSPYRHSSSPEGFHQLFGYILGNRDGIDNWHVIPARLRRSIGRQLAPVRAGSGVVEKNIEVRVNRRFKRQGRSWTRPGAEHLAQLLWLQSHPTDWNHWWNKTALAKTKVNPGWPSSAPPSN